MARIPYPDLDALPERVQESLAALPALNIFRMLAHAETAVRPSLRFGGAILTRLELDPKLRELAILQVAREAQAEYEWVQHAEIGRQVGLTDAQIVAVKGDDPGALDEAQRAVVDFARRVVAGPRVDDGTFAALAAQLPPRQIVELLLTIGQYLMLARVMTTLELEIDAAAGGQLLA
jgi:alkylhydroperoxidase family enzyme